MLQFIKRYSFGFILLGLAAYFIGRYFYLQPKVVNGENAPVIKGQLIDGTAFDLKDLEGKYVLVDFWGSWCGPCLVEIPGLKKLHQKYKAANFEDAKGLTIVSVGVERDERRWEKTILRTGMNWDYHLLDISTSLKFLNGPIAEEFGVKQVPSKFLLNESGVIIGVNQSIEALDAFLEKRLKE